MKAVAIAGATTLAVVASAAAHPGLSEADYMRASRCKGLAAGFGVLDPGFGVALKAAYRDRPTALQERAAAEFAPARREAAHSDGHSRLAAEFLGGCGVFLTGHESNAVR